MASLHYCNTHYDCTPPLDINPLILRRFPEGNILVLCAREGMVKRISHGANIWPYNQYPDQSVVALGWWEAQDFDLVDSRGYLHPEDLLAQDAVVIVGRDRIDPMFHGLLAAVEDVFCVRLMPAA